MLCYSMARYSQTKRKWRRVLERWCVQEQSRTSIKVAARLAKGERIFQAPQNLHIMVHAASMTFCGEYVIDTEDPLVIGLIKEGASMAFVEWDTIVVVELH